MPDTTANSLNDNYIRTDDIKAAARNPRLHTTSQVKRIMKSIEEFGFVFPISIDQHGNIIAGHARHEAAIKLKLKDVPVVRIGHLSPHQVEALRIADNRLADLSKWDENVLTDTLKELSALDIGFDLEATGFTVGEIDFRIESAVTHIETPDVADEIPETVGDVHKTKLGDIWRLGRNIVICGDCRSAEIYEKLLGREKAHVTFADPPYNVPINGYVSGRGNIQHREFVMGSGELDPAAFQAFLQTSCSLIAKHCVDGAIIFICMDWRHSKELQDAASRALFEPNNLCVWVKGNAGMGTMYRSQHELVFVYKNGIASYRNNIQLGKNGRNRSNVWSYPSPSSFGRSSEEGCLAALHPTVKPVTLVADAILDCSARGDIVLDPFMGSGTTIIAAERVGRRCRGIEIDPLYVDTIVRRWQAYTGERAVHASSGVRFDDVGA